MSTKKPDTLFNRGFTVVELVVVIVVIAILAAITTVSYSIIRDNANTKALITDLQSVGSQLSKVKADSGGFPLAANFESSIELANTSGKTTYEYDYDSLTGSYCLVATGFDRSYYITDSNAEPREGAC